MAKSVRSWSKSDNMPDLIGIKTVDSSIFKYGTHIPVEFHEDFQKANGGVYINRGEAKQVTLILDDFVHSRLFKNCNFLFSRFNF